MAKSTRPNPADGTATLIFGIVCTVVGGALLIERLTGAPVWDYLWRLWPVLLIIMGVKILLDYRSSRPKTPREPQ
jgi:uncharacterized protein (DUF983 family)